ncbi:hypothetical protein C5167_029297 [Papaver somniferum]|uniref:elongator complex protein 6-like n=1 Tax=Papaver somniferum TaxID=3469 RepID=UPI000E6F82F9|nr:elongator complex protein 6-like [Papaver somniferum]RZC93223.1 hypothetical protein C5167_029297 [Papaver somniferum]
MERSLNLLDETLVHIPSSKGRVILIEDQVETKGAFVRHHLIKRSLSIESSEIVIFVALSKPFSHYYRILRKLGCSLVAQSENAKFIFIDMLKICTTVMMDDSSPFEVAAKGSSTYVLDFLHYCHTLTSENISLCGNPHFFLFIDISVNFLRS